MLTLSASSPRPPPGQIAIPLISKQGAGSSHNRGLVGTPALLPDGASLGGGGGEGSGVVCSSPRMDSWKPLANNSNLLMRQGSSAVHFKRVTMPAGGDGQDLNFPVADGGKGDSDPMSAPNRFAKVRGINVYCVGGSR